MRRSRSRSRSANVGDAQVDQFLVSRLAQPVLEDPLLRLEWGQLVEAQRADGDLEEFALGNAERALLLAQVVTAGVQQGLERDEAHEL